MSKETKINTENKNLLSEKFETKSDNTVFQQMKKEESNNNNTTPYSKLKTCKITQIIETKENNKNEITENPENNIINEKNEKSNTVINFKFPVFDFNN